MMTNIDRQETRTATYDSCEPNLPGPPATTPESIGPFRIEAVLGEGGMGTAYAAVDTRHGTRVALKALPVGLDEVRLRALKREFRLISEFIHGNVVEMYDLRAEQGTWYIVMELVDGVEFVASFRNSGWNEPRALETVRQLACGLHGLHLAGWLHRDLKSSNVLVERNTERTVILDFGLAEDLQGMRSRERQVFGTRSHMAPELLAGGAATIISDWYAVGVMLCGALLGELPQVADRPAHLRELASTRGGAESLLLQLSADLLHPMPEQRLSAAQVFARLGLPAPKPARLTGMPAVEGREAELQLLAEALAAADVGAVVQVVVESGAGLGKTSLVGEFLARLDHRKARHVLRSRCHVNEHIPFKAVDRLVEELVLETTSRSNDPAPPGERSLSRISELFPALANLPGVSKSSPTDITVPPPQRRTEAFLELRELFDEVRAQGTVVVFIDDAHQGDVDSVSLLRAILDGEQRPGAHGVLLIWTQRPGKEHTPFIAEAARMPICRTARVEKISLSPLTSAVATRIAKKLLPEATEEDVRTLVQEVNGSPLLLTKARNSGVRRVDGGTGSFLQALVDADLARTSLPVRRLLGIVAVASAPIAVDVALRAAGQGYDAYRSLATLRQANLVNVTSDASLFPGEDCLELYHDELREPVLLGVVVEGERVGLHRDLARSLEGSKRRHAGLLSVHLHAAGEADAAAVYATQAADEAEALLAFGAAAGHLRHALSWGAPTQEVRTALQTRLAEALFNSGDCVAAAKAYEVARSNATDAVKRQLAVKQASSWFSAGHVEEGIQSILPLLKRLGIAPPSKALLMPTIALKVLRLRWRGLELPSSDRRPDPERVFRADACWSMGCGLSIFLSMQSSYFIIQSLLEALPLGDVRRIGRGLAFVGGVCVNMPKLDVWGNACLAKAEELATKFDDSYLLGWCKVWRANAELIAGRLVEATRLAEDAIQLIEHGPYAMTWECHTARCFALMAKERRGELLQVEHEANQVLHKAALNDDLYGCVVFSLFSAQVALAKDDVARARELAQSAMQRWTKDNFTIQHFYALRIETYCDLYEGKLESARDRVIANWKTIQSSDVAIVLSAKMESQLLRAQVELALAGASSAARSGHLKSVARLSVAMERSCPEGRGFAWLLRGCASMVRGERATAADEASVAADAFEQLGMQVWAQVARRSQHTAAGNTARRAQNEVELARLGVGDSGRWLSAVTPGFA